ncbi:MAG: hypothetical protein JXC32_20195, partial [Anaerolineae bacterium]|nr:hypothetical protein [Anaerolineae bacterium]
TGRDETTGTETVEVIHEALIRSWGQTQVWMAEDRSFRSWQERLRIGLHTWESSGHDEGALLRGAPLAEAETWLRLRAVDLGQAERTFVEEGLALRGRRAAEREAQRQAELEAARRLQEAHGVALRQAAIGLASEARLQMQGPNQDLAVLLALEAVGAYPYTWQAELALAEIVCDFRLVWRFAHGVPVMWPAQVAPDGTKFLTASNDGVLRVFDLATGKNLLTVQAYEGVAANWHRARWSPSGDRILTHSPYSGTPRVWDAQSGELLVECVADGNSLAEWDGTRIVTYRMDRVVRIWDARTGEQLHALTGIEDQYVSLSPDGKWIATWTGQIWDAETGELAYTLAECEEAIAQGERSWFSWSPDGARLGTGIAGTAWVWDAATGEEVLALQTGYRGKADLRWSLDGRRLLVTGYTGDDSRAAIWDAANGEKLRELPFTDGLFYPIEPWSPQGDRIAVPDAQGHVTIYDAYSGVEVLRLPVGTDRPCVTWLPDGSGFATAGDDLARIWRIAAPGFTLSSERDTPPDTWEGPNIAAWSPDDTRIARPFDDGSVRVWDAASRRECVRITRGIPRPGIAINWVAWSPDSGRILTGGGDGGVEIWDAASGARVLRLAGHGDVALDEHWSVGHVVMGLAWSPDGMRALTTGRDHRAVIWDTATGAVLREFPGREYYDGAWSPDGRRVALCDQFGYGGPVKVWDAETGEALLTLLPDDFGYGTSGVAWSPDGTRIVTFSLDGVGRLWDAATGALVGTFAVRDFCSGAQWSPTGDRFLVGSYGVGVRVWDAATLQQVAGYPGGPSGSTGSWSPDGTAIAIGYANGDTKVYPAWESLEELIAYAKAHCVLRELTPEERAQYGLPER